MKTYIVFLFKIISIHFIKYKYVSLFASIFHIFIICFCLVFLLPSLSSLARSLLVFFPSWSPPFYGFLWPSMLWLAVLHVRWYLNMQFISFRSWSAVPCALISFFILTMHSAILSPFPRPYTLSIPPFDSPIIIFYFRSSFGLKINHIIKFRIFCCCNYHDPLIIVNTFDQFCSHEMCKPNNEQKRRVSKVGTKRMSGEKRGKKPADTLTHTKITASKHKYLNTTVLRNDWEPHK